MRYRIQDAGCKMQDAGYKLQNKGERQKIFVTRYLIQDSGSWI